MVHEAIGKDITYILAFTIYKIKFNKNKNKIKNKIESH